MGFFNIIYRDGCVLRERETLYTNVPGSETYATTKNGRRLLKVKCANCGITKTKFISSNSNHRGGGGGIPWFVDAKKGITLLKDALRPYSEEDAKARYERNKREHAKYKKEGGTQSFKNWMIATGQVERPTFP